MYISRYGYDLARIRVKKHELHTWTVDGDRCKNITQHICSTTGHWSTKHDLRSTWNMQDGTQHWQIADKGVNLSTSRYYIDRLTFITASKIPEQCLKNLFQRIENYFAWYRLHTPFITWIFRLDATERNICNSQRVSKCIETPELKILHVCLCPSKGICKWTCMSVKNRGTLELVDVCDESALKSKMLRSRTLVLEITPPPSMTRANRLSPRRRCVLAGGGAEELKRQRSRSPECLPPQAHHSTFFQ